MRVEAYKGEDTYIFISYAHRDMEQVLPIVQRMIQEGYRVWYDEGIDPGTEWDANIAWHIRNCSYFIAFVSPTYMLSDNCRDELSFARDHVKNRLLIYLEETVLDDGMAMRVSRLQAIFKYAYTREDDFYQKLFAAHGIHALNDNYSHRFGDKKRKD